MLIYHVYDVNVWGWGNAKRSATLIHLLIIGVSVSGL